MIYRLPACAKTPLRILTLLCLIAAPALAADQGPGPSLRFTTEGDILPRRGHETLMLESRDIDRLDAAILHVPEADTLMALQHPDAPIPPEATEVWRGQIAVGDGKTSLDVLGAIKQLQPGLYIARVHEATTGRPRAEARKPIMISNIGLEAFGGADGIVAEARLLSEATPAGSIDVALVARNNREIARVRTDANGVARFDHDQISGAGEDAPAALYAYGADGEFTALPVAAIETPPPPRAWIVTDKQAYRPGEEIRGLVLLRNIDSHALESGKVYAQLETASGEAAEIQPALREVAGLHLHAPALALGTAWNIRIYRAPDDNQAKPVLLGTASVTVGAAQASLPVTAAPTPTPFKGDIVISPGRRSFQRGEVANISVQPSVDADVTVALVDTSVRTLIRQHIGKEGAVVELPIPTDASGGMYVIATAFVPPGANGQPLRRSFGMQWIEIDEGSKRMGVRLDTPEKVETGGKLAVSVTLPDAADKSSTILLVGTDASLAVALDPFAFFYGRRPLAVTVADSYADVIGAPNAPPPFAAPVAAANAPAAPVAPAVLWEGPAAASGTSAAKFVEIAPALPGAGPRLRISAIASSADKVGYAEASVSETPAGKARKASILKPRPSRPVTIRATQLKPGGTLTLKSGQAAIASIDAIVAAPVSYGSDPRFVAVDSPALRDFTSGLIGPVDAGAAVRGAVVAFALDKRELPFPRDTREKLLDAAETVAANPTADPVDVAVARFILIRAGRENALELKHWLQGNPRMDGMLASASRLALSDIAPPGDGDRAGLVSAIEKDAGADLDTRALTLLILGLGNQPWPPALAQSVAAEAAKHPALPARTALALAVAEALHQRRGDPKLTVSDKHDATACVRAAATTSLENADTRPLYLWIVSGLPPQD